MRAYEAFSAIKALLRVRENGIDCTEGGGRPAICCLICEIEAAVYPDQRQFFDEYVNNDKSISALIKACKISLHAGPANPNQANLGP